MKPGYLGSHSNHKSLATYTRREGYSRDNVDPWHRQKGNTGIVNIYVDALLPVLDARVAAVVSVGGAIKYAIAEDSNVTYEWILENISLIYPI